MVFLKGLKKTHDDAKGIWSKSLHEIIWSYDTTRHSTTKETQFSMVYEAYIILPIDIDTPSWWLSQFYQEVNKAGLECVVDLVDELR